MAQFDKRTSIVLAIVGACTLNMPLVFVSQPVFGRMKWTALELGHSSRFTGGHQRCREAMVWITFRGSIAADSLRLRDISKWFATALVYFLVKK
jgi:hypothetical protein